MSLVEIILSVLVILAIVLPPIAWLIIKRMELKGITDTLVVFEDTSKTEGSMLGNLILKEVGRNGRVMIKFLPRDKTNPKPQIVIVESNKIEVYPKGTYSNERNIIKVLPQDSLTYYSNVFAKIENLNAQNHIIMGQKEGLARAQAHLDEMGEGELSRQDIALKNSFVDSIIKQKSKEDVKTNRPGSYISPSRDTFL